MSDAELMNVLTVGLRHRLRPVVCGFNIGKCTGDDLINTCDTLIDAATELRDRASKGSIGQGGMAASTLANRPTDPPVATGRYVTRGV